MMRKENAYQSTLIKKLEERFPDAIVLKNDPSYLQGIPDLTIFERDRWATLETKRSAKATHQPNQDHYVEKMDSMSFSRFICPENEEEVLYDLEQALHKV
jgi:hypothetical protein